MEASDPSILNALLQDHKSIIVIDFYAVWCGPCKQFSPIFEQLSEQFPLITFLKVDIDKNAMAASRFNVQSVPTIVITYKGNTVKRIQGGDANQICSTINTHFPPILKSLKAVDCKDTGNQILKLLNRHDKAIQWYTQGILVSQKNDNTLGILYSNRSACYLSMNQYDEALCDAEKALELNPKWNKAYIRKAKVLERMFLFDHAIHLLQKALSDGELDQTDELNSMILSLQNNKAKWKQKTPDNNNAMKWKSKGNESFASKNFALAIYYFTAAIENNPFDHVLFGNRGTALMQLGKWSYAISDFDTAIQIHPQYMKAYSRKARCLQQMNKLEEAKEVIRNGLEIDSNDAELLKMQK